MMRLTNGHVQGCLGLIAALGLVPLAWRLAALAYAALVRSKQEL